MASHFGKTIAAATDFIYIAVIILALGLIPGCASGPEIQPLTPAEQIRADFKVGRELTEDFESRIKLKQDIEVNLFMRGIAEKLAATAPELKDSPIGVFTIADRESRWRDYSLPGNRIYLSVGLMRNLDFENEAAAAIALELGSIINRNALARLAAADKGASAYDRATDSSTKIIDYFGPNGIFAYNEEAWIASMKAAVAMMYNAGYDPRGLIALFEQYSRHEDRSPFEPTALGRLTESTRQTIAIYSPLRNPIVRSRAFLAIRKRIENL